MIADIFIKVIFDKKRMLSAVCKRSSNEFFLFFLMCRPIPSFVTQSYFLQSSSVLQSRLASTSSRAEGDTFTSNDVTANDNHQLLVGSIINPSGFSIEGMYPIQK